MKKIVEITTLKELIEMATMGAGSVAGHVNQEKKEENTMRREIQSEILLRKYIRNKIKESLKKDNKQEQQLRQVIRGLIKEAKEQANPHPSTGINKLRDAFRKAKPSIKSKFQQLTTSEEQRTSFIAHLLNAQISLFQQLDAINAQAAEGPAPSAPAEEAPAAPSSDDLAPPPEGGDIESKINDELSGLLQEIAVEVEDDKAFDVVSDEPPAPKTQVEKDVAKKKEVEAEREEFGSGLDDMDRTGRNQAFDAFRQVQSYFADAYLDLDNETDRQMFKDWCLYNLELLLQNYETELNPGLEKPEITNPEVA